MKCVTVAQLPPMAEGAETHVVALVTRLLEVARRTLMTQDWGGLRPSHFRLLSQVPPDGITISALAVALSMTKQAVGQFVAHLQATGHVQVVADGADRRRRVVMRTASGDLLTAEVNATIAAVERHWRAQVGERRYLGFRHVLGEITGATPHAFEL